MDYDKERLISIIIIVVSLILSAAATVYVLFIRDYGDEEKSEVMPEIVGYDIRDVEGCYSRFFTLNIVEERYSDYPDGVILSQSIVSGEKYKSGDTVVDIVVSAGEKPAETAVVTTAPPETEPVVTEPPLETGLLVDSPVMAFETSAGGEACEVKTNGIDREDEEMSAALDELYNVLIKRCGDAGFLYIDLETGASVEYNADEKFSAASIIKAPYVRAVLGQESDLSRSFEMTEEMLNSPSELVNGEPVGTEFTTKELAQAAISESDNTAFKMLYNYIGYDCFNELSGALNVPVQMTDDNYWFRLTARQTGVYFKDIYYFNEEHQNGALMKQYLDESENNDLFAEELSEYTVCEKYGYLPQEEFYTLGDAAIVYAEKPYILIGYVRGTGTQLNTQFFRDTARCADNIHTLLHEN